MPRISRKQRVAAPIGGCGHGTKVYKAAIYVRLSVEDIRKRISDSIGTQKAMLMNYIQTQPDLQLCEVYEDVNCTGTNFNRPGFSRMIEDIQNGLVDCVIVKDLSRFGRSFEEMGHYLENVFPFLQVRFIAVNDNYDSLTAGVDESGLIVPLKNLMNEVYARDISKKVKSGYEAKGRRGEFCGAFAPYGYIKTGTSLVVDEETAPVVRQIFEWVLEGMSDVGIAQKLNGQKITPPSRYRFEKGITKAKKHEDTKFWYKSAVGRIAENLVYTGVLVSGKYQSNFLSGGGRTTKNNDEWIITNNAHIAIIDSDTFERVRLIREGRKAAYKVDAPSVQSDNIFKGLIFCGDCGSHMTRRKRRGKYVFMCNVYEEVDKGACTSKTIQEKTLHTALYTYISHEISLAVDMTRIIEEVQSNSSFQSHRVEADKQINALQKRLEQNRRFRGSLREDYTDGVLSEQDYTQMRAEYDNEKDKLQRELGALIQRKQSRDNALSPENKWIAEFRRFETEKLLTAGMLSALVARIAIFDGARIEVTMRYRDEFEALRSYLDDYTKEGRAVNE